MNFLLVQKVVANIINSIETSAVMSVRALKTHVFNVKVENLPEVQKISGEVAVDQTTTHSKIEEVSSLLKKLSKAVFEYKSPGEIKISNFPKPEKFPEFPKKM